MKRFQDEKLVQNKACGGESLNTSYDNNLLQDTWLSMDVIMEVKSCSLCT